MMAYCLGENQLKRICLIVMIVAAAPLAAHASASSLRSEGVVEGEMRQWHRVTITFDGPVASEDGAPNPFLDYRMTVTFIKGYRRIQVPGFFAADGNAAETGATSGDKWRVRFTPDAQGLWRYEVSFRQGDDIALSLDPSAGEPAAFDGAKGAFKIAPSDKGGRDFRGKGMLQYTGERYWRFSGDGSYYLKGGADSPENFLAYEGFDDTYRYSLENLREGEARPSEEVHRYEPHLDDWHKGDPTWKGGKGKSIIGALNYLSDKGMNSVYFLTMNVIGDGRDVWPWTGPEERMRFDCSKLDQWEIVFSHMDYLGLMMHVILQEQEIDQLLDGGELGPERKLYFRELIARFAHHPALVWNFGEENTNTTEQIKDYADFFDALDPYQHPRVMHTFPGRYDEQYTPLLGGSWIQGPSLQMGDPKKTHSETLKWVNQSAESGYPWVVCLDEIGPAHTGVKPDADDPNHDEVRRYPLWGNLMAGGAGCEWYFGYRFAHNDLNLEDWRSRDRMWDLTRYALDFFHRHIPFPEMESMDELTGNDDDYVFAKPGEVYAVYSPDGAPGAITLEAGDYSVAWYDPRNGGELQVGAVDAVSGPGEAQMGRAPGGPGQDWVVLLKRIPDSE